jgi:hypothetical protein
LNRLLAVGFDGATDQDVLAPLYVVLKRLIRLVSNAASPVGVPRPPAVVAAVRAAFRPSDRSRSPP